MTSVKKSVEEEEGDVEPEEVYLVITPAERAAVCTLQSRGPADPGINWKVIARHLQVSVAYLKALVKIRLPEQTNLIPMSSLCVDPGDDLSE